LDVQDFEPLKVIGRGAFGEVSEPCCIAFGALCVDFLDTKDPETEML